MSNRVGEAEGPSQALWRSENHDSMADIGHLGVYSVGVWFCLSVILFMPCFPHFGIREYLTCFFDFYRNLQLRDIGWLKAILKFLKCFNF